MRTKPSTKRRKAPAFGVALCVATVSVGLVGVAPALADADDIAQVEQRVQALEERSAEASNRAVTARYELADVQVKLDELTQKLTEARENLAAEQDAMAGLARQIYVNGGMDTATAGFALEDPDAFIDSLERVAAAGANQSTAVGRATAAAEAVAAAEAAVAAERDEKARVTAELEEAREAARAALAEAQSELERLKEEERKRIAEAIAAAREAARIAAEQEAARARAEAEARAAAEAAARAAEQARQAGIAAAVVQQWQTQAAQSDAAAAAAAQAAAAAAAASQYSAAPQAVAPAAPAPSTQSSGGAPANVSAWADSSYSQAIKMCESSGNYSINTGNGYYGAWQFDYPSWHDNGGGQFAEFPHQATKEQQDYVAWSYYQRAGWRPWECALKIG